MFLHFCSGNFALLYPLESSLNSVPLSTATFRRRRFADAFHLCADVNSGRRLHRKQIGGRAAAKRGGEARWASR
jgi:hypothetical protein